MSRLGRWSAPCRAGGSMAQVGTVRSGRIVSGAGTPSSSSPLSLPLKLSLWPFCQELSGSTNRVVSPIRWSQARPLRR